MKKIYKILIFAAIYIAIFVVLFLVSGALSNWGYDKSSMRQTVSMLSILTPTSISYSTTIGGVGRSAPTETMSVESFNALFILINFLYTLLVYKLILRFIKN